ncbi:MAG: hypothetical protein LBH25_11605 [Fibromonadaceae bacterium]|jgi:hypothetical protein|nr:hypothetical protein [Fibromonadaceae bacterium]
MKQIIILFLILNASVSFAHLSYIDFSKVSNDKKLVSAFDFVKNNKQYYDHWSPKWNYDKPKQDLINQLREYHKDFSALAKKNAETYLLLGDIAHYLFNMNDTAYHSIAAKNYNEAIKSNSKDYRAYWFLAYHYALSNRPILAIDNFKKAEKLLPSKQSADFWNDYALAASVANMPSHSIYAMDKVKSISGKEGSFQRQLGETVYRRIDSVDKKQSYVAKDIWAVSQDDKKIILTSKPLGIKVLLDSTWDLSLISDYQKNATAIAVKPPAIISKKERKIGYTIAIMAKTVDDNEKLDDFINSFVSGYSNKKKISFSNKYEKMIAYEIIEKTVYQEMGGGHMYMVSFERNEPRYPGLLLELPQALPESNSDDVIFLTPLNSKGRFNGKIFYLIMLDSCEEINEQSLSVFKSLFNSQMIVE